MAFKKLFFGKNKDNDDGQDEFFKDDFEPVFYPSPKKKSKPESAKPAPKEEKTAEIKKAVAKTTSKSAQKAEATATVKAEEKKSASAKKAPEKATASAKATAATKTQASKKAASIKEKTNDKATKSTKSTEKTTSKTVDKAVTKATPAQKKAVAPAKAKTAVKSSPKASAKSKKIANEVDLADDSPIVKGAVAVSESTETANGKWEIRRAKDGRYFFALYASNHTVIAYSQIYSSTTAVNTGINSVIANAQKCETEDTTLKKTVSLPCPKWEIYFDKADQYRFRLYAPNGLCICHSSHGYSTKSGCKGGIESIKRFSTEAKVSKSYKK